MSYPAPEIVSVDQVRRAGLKVSWSINSTALVLSYWVKMKEGTDSWVIVERDIPKQATHIEINNNLISGESFYSKKKIEPMWGLGIVIEFG